MRRPVKESVAPAVAAETLARERSSTASFTVRTWVALGMVFGEATCRDIRRAVARTSCSTAFHRSSRSPCRETSSAACSSACWSATSWAMANRRARCASSARASAG
ncbi:hypothetical protein ACFFX0_16770 [Citricoccus parietis]|uniref:Uncharacterized protein n=1 Tax=Citricoccus parietis TaxID=592307 RepID=A0ABV5G1F0_9MICC